MTKTQLERRLFTPEEANASLPLVRAIVSDITALSRGLRERQERLSRVKPPHKGGVGQAHREELEQAQEEFERDQERLRGYVHELSELGVELKDFETGLVDFPCRMMNRIVLLCWQFGEPAVEYWHELDAGFAGRQKLKTCNQ